MKRYFIVKYKNNSYRFHWESERHLWALNWFGFNWLYFFIVVMVFQVVICGTICSRDQVHLYSRCAEKFIRVTHDGKVLANDMSNNPRKFKFTLLIFLVKLTQHLVKLIRILFVWLWNIWVILKNVACIENNKCKFIITMNHDSIFSVENDRQ